MVVALPATSAAQYNKSEEAQESVKVIAHIELPGMHVNSMFVQHRDNKDYLYLHRPTKQAFAVVDVTKPNKPVIVERAALPEPARARVDVNSAEPLLAISVTPEVNAEARLASTKSGNDASQINLPTETVSLVDLTNPKNPKIIKTFKGVTSYLPDDSRKLIYVVNPEGLWVVHHQQSQPMRFCTSEDALMQEPNCQ
jgi:hypothetical protein